MSHNHQADDDLYDDCYNDARHEQDDCAEWRAHEMGRCFPKVCDYCRSDREREEQQMAEDHYAGECNHNCTICVKEGSQHEVS